MPELIKNSSIAEVNCEVQFNAAKNWDVTDIGSLYERLKDRLPHKRTISMFRPLPLAMMEPTVTNVHAGQFVSDSGLELCKVAPHCLLIERLRPYSSWESYRELIKYSVEHYVQLREEEVSLCSLKYSNLFEFPGDKVSVDQYFNFRPYVGGELPKEYGPFSLGIQLPQEDGADMMKVQLHTTVPAKPHTTSVVLGLQYFLAIGKFSDRQHFYSWLEKAHDVIHKTFRACITDETVAFLNMESES